MNKIKVQLNNFKCFEDITFHLNNITFLTGANAAGKSSLIQALLLADAVGQARDERVSEVKIALDDASRALDLGRVDNLINNSSGQDEVHIHIDETTLWFCGGDEVADGFLLMRCERMGNDGQQGMGKMTYLNAERQGPRREVELEKTRKADCGCHGEHTASVILNNEFTKIPASKCYVRNATEDINFRIALDSWMQLIFPDITVHVSATGNTKCQVMVNNENLGVKNIATNVGFGISYVLPILVTCLLAAEQETIIIENPEAHLHAKAQSNMGYFLGVMAAAGLRIIVETHSEHIINGIRRAIVCDEVLDPSGVTIYFLDVADRHIQQTEICIDNEGNLSKFPIDFFDQQRQDSKHIFEAIRNKHKTNRWETY